MNEERVYDDDYDDEYEGAYDDPYDEDAYGDDPYRERHREEMAEDEDGTWLDEGLITLLLVAGVILFLFPEPITTSIGIILLAAGVILWVADAIV